MSEAPKPKRTRAKARPAGLASDSQAAPGIERPAAGSSGTAAPAASGAASDAPTPQRDTGDASTTATPAGATDAGNVPDLSGASDGFDPAAALARTRTRERLMKRDDWDHISRLAKDMRSECNRARMTTEAREAWVWSELDRLYPPILIDPKAQSTAHLNDQKSVSEVAVSTSDNRTLKGLGDIPPDWPPLPANAALSVELGWVQSNRLYVVEELVSGGTRVHLDRAHEPAPSRSAIGWLETSIRSYAKFVEVAAKVTGSGDEDHEDMKRERLAIEEIRGLLREMARNPTGPGR